MRKFTRPQPQPIDGTITLTSATTRCSHQSRSTGESLASSTTARIRRGSIESDGEWLRIFAYFGIPVPCLAQRFVSEEDGATATASDLHHCLSQLILGDDGFAAHPLRDGQKYVFDDAAARELACTQGTASDIPRSSSAGVVALLMDDRMLLHESQDARMLEAPVRLARAYAAIQRSRFVQESLANGSLCRVTPRLASLEEVLLVHDKAVYTPFLEGSALLSQLIPLKTDVYVCADSAVSARVACAGVVDCALWLWQAHEHPPGPRSAFAIVRPPGHHCSRSVPSGFCLVNNVAVAVRRVQQEAATAGEHRTPRIAILDLDVHHGEGTQALLEEDASVLIVSLHRYDQGEFYPQGSAGAASHRGPHDNVVNIAFNTAPMDPEKCEAVISDLCFLRSWQRLVQPALDRHAPDLVVVSLGFDAALGDPLGKMAVEKGFVTMLRYLKQWAQGSPNCRGVCCALEGGYNPSTVAQQCIDCLECLLGKQDAAPPGVGAIPGTWKVVRQKLMAQSSEEEPATSPAAARAKNMRTDDELWEAHVRWIENELDRVEAERAAATTPDG